MSQFISNMFLLNNSTINLVNQVTNFPIIFNVSFLIARLLLSGLVIEATYLCWYSLHHRPISLYSFDVGIVLIRETFIINKYPFIISNFSEVIEGKEGWSNWNNLCDLVNELLSL